jgi:putative transposase
MPRPLRVVTPGQPLHVIQRGNNRVATFVTPRDLEIFRLMLLEASRNARCAIHAYVLMTNHFHVLMTPEDECGPARMMQILGRRYVRYFNDRRSRTGTLWDGRYRSARIDSANYFFACSRYIELNPVRAGLVDEPSDFHWSSFNCNALGDPDDLITPHRLYFALGARPAEQRLAYRGMFDEILHADVIDEIRRSTKAGRSIGDPMHRSSLVGLLDG